MSRAIIFGFLAITGALGGACLPRQAGTTAATPAAGAAATASTAATPTGPIDPTPSPTCARPGCIRTATKIGDFPLLALRATVDPRVVIDNGYTVWAIEYLTGTQTSLATVTIPFPATPPSGGYAIVANNHGTVGLDDPCKLTGTVSGAGLSGLFGARGMIGVASDYPGLGTPGVLPYLVSDVEGKASLDGLRAARDLARWQNVAISERYAVAGLSEGGHATLAAAALHQAYAPELDIRGFAAAAPASMFEEDWRAGFVDGPLVTFQAMLVYAWADHYAYSGPEIWGAGMQPTIAGAMTHECVGGWGSSGLAAAIGSSKRAVVFSSGFLTAYETGNWGAYAVFGKAFTENRIGPYTQTAPLKIYQGDADTIVFPLTTGRLVGALRKGGVTLDYEIVPAATHLDLAFGFVASYERRTEGSIEWIRAQLAR